jgi:AcrR family transcriptional regulator
MTERKPTSIRRAELADAALRIVATRGIAALSTRALADEAGLTTGALFRHYPSLDDLLVGVCARAAELLGATFPDPALPPRERLAEFTRARLALVREHPGVPQLVLSDQFALALPDEGREHLRVAVRATHGFLAGAFRDGQRRGEVRADVDPDGLASLFLGAMQIAALTARTGVVSAPSALRALETLAFVSPLPEEKP